HRAGEVRLVALAVVQGAVHAAAVRHADNHRYPKGAVRPIAHAADLGDDLVESGVHEVRELHLGDGSQAVDRRPSRRSGDQSLAEGRVEDALVTVLGPQAIGRTKDAALATD